MKVLVTGGTGVVGEGAIAALLARGHTVRLFSRHADRDAGRWAAGVEPRVGDVSEPADVKGSAVGCDGVLHIAGIVAEEPPDVTLEKVNVEGTRHVVEEAMRASANRFVFVSSLGADRGSSAYHHSKLKAEGVVTASKLHWVIVRPGNVYGPGDTSISKLIVMTRALPAMPVVEDGTQRFQPIWFEDLGQALVTALQDTRIVRRTLEVAGPDQTTVNEVLDHLCQLTGRDPARVRVPGRVAKLGLKAASMLGIAPVSDAQLTMLGEENIIGAGRENALTSVLGVEGTPLLKGLRQALDQLPEQLSTDGVGPLQHKRYFADIRGGWRTAEQMEQMFRRRFAEVIPLEVGVEPHALGPLKKGTTFGVALPGRGVLAMRIEEVTKTSITAATLQGHSLAGTVAFHFLESGPAVRFEVEIFARPADTLDRIVMQTIGGFMQDANWRAVVERMVALSGGEAKDGVQTESRSLDREEAREVEQRVATLVRNRKKEISPSPRDPGARAAREEQTVTVIASGRTPAAVAAAPRRSAAPSRGQRRVSTIAARRPRVTATASSSTKKQAAPAKNAASPIARPASKKAASPARAKTASNKAAAAVRTKPARGRASRTKAAPAKKASSAARAKTAAAAVRSRSRRPEGGTGSVRRSQAGSGSARTSGRTARRAGARSGS